MAAEHHRLPGKPVEVQRVELVSAPGAQQVPVQAVEQHDDHAVVSLWPDATTVRIHPRNLVRAPSGTSRCHSG